MSKKSTFSLLFFLLIILLIHNIMPVTYARYVSVFSETISLNLKNPEYTIKFHSNSGSGTMDDQVFEYNKAENLNANEFEKYGYDFISWNTKTDGSGTSYDDEDEIYNLTNVDGEEFDIYAQWQNVINIRIEDASLFNSSNGNATDIEFDYETPTLSNLKSTVSLNNANSYVTLDIDITNYLNKKMGIYSITGLPDNLEYEIVNNYNVKDKLCDASLDNSGKDASIQLRIKYKNGGYIAGNTTYNLDLDILFKEVYNITYKNIYTTSYPFDVHDENYPIDITEDRYPHYIMADDSLEVEFYPHIPTHLSVTDTVTSEYEQPVVTLSNATGDVEIESLTPGEYVMYDHEGSVVFNGSNYINTYVALLNSENAKKDVRITFNIDRYENTQNDLATLFNSMDESGSPYPGFFVRANANNNYRFTANYNGTSFTADSAMNQTSKVEILRKNNILYIKYGNNDYAVGPDTSSLTNYFDVPATFGSSYKNGAPFRYFKGTLSNMEIRFLESEKDSSVYKVKYENAGPVVFNGTNNINTNINLFDRTNANKDFEISFDLNSTDSGQTGLATIANCMNEGGSPWPGFTFRVGNGEYELVGNNSNVNSGVTVVQTLNSVTSVKISRINGIIYYSFNGGQTYQLQDYTNFNSYFSVPLTFGSNINGSGNPERYFKGTLSNIVVKLKE